MNTRTARKGKKQGKGRRGFFHNTAPARTLGNLLGAEQVRAWRSAPAADYSAAQRSRSIQRNYALSEGRL